MISYFKNAVITQQFLLNLSCQFEFFKHMIWDLHPKRPVRLLLVIEPNSVPNHLIRILQRINRYRWTHCSLIVRKPNERLIIVVKNSNSIVQHIRHATQQKSFKPMQKPRQAFSFDPNEIERRNRGQAYDTEK